MATVVTGMHLLANYSYR